MKTTFGKLTIGEQFVSPQGGVVCTKISKGKAAFTNERSKRVFTVAENWNRKVIKIA